MTTDTSTGTSTDSHAAPNPNVTTVMAIYEAFGRGDVPAILTLLSPDVSWDGDWADNWGQRPALDHFAPRRGHAQVGEFFGALSTFTVRDFQVLDLAASERQVVAQIVIEFEMPNGGALRDEEMHLWTFGPDGLVTALRHYIDTAKHQAAAAGTDTRTAA